MMLCVDTAFFILFFGDLFPEKRKNNTGEVKACIVGHVGTRSMKEIPSALDETPSSSNAISEQLSRQNSISRLKNRSPTFFEIWRRTMIRDI
jgi:hypothetical protein